MSNEETVSISVTISARRDDVFMALTDSDLIRKWSGEEATVSRTVGGEFAMFNRWVTGRVLDFKPPRLVSFSWLVSEWPEGSSESHVTIALEEQENGTLVTLTHRGFPNAEEAESHRTAWMEQVFDPLRRFLETGEVAEPASSAESREMPAEEKKERQEKRGERKPVRKKAKRKRSSDKREKAKKKATRRKPVKKKASKKPVKKKARKRK